MASQAWTYLLWLFGGWIGLHHVYLGRCDQALAYFVTLGGGFGIAWMRDFFRISDYVNWANGDKEFQRRHMHRMAANPKPGCSTFRAIGMAVLGIVLSSVLCGVLPPLSEEYAKSESWLYYAYWCTTSVLAIAGSTIGVYLVANIGEFQCAIFYPLVGASASIPWLVYSPSSCSTTAIMAALFTCYKGLRWRRLNPPAFSEDGTPLKPSGKHHRRRGHCVNFSVFFLLASIWLCLIGYGIYYNGEITVNGGEKIPVHEAVNNFFKSEAWQKTKDAMYQIYQIYRHRGFWQAYEDLKAALDLFGEGAALEVIGLEKTASEEEITKRCRQLSRDNHPDRHKTEEEKEAAQRRFIEIQDACNKLSTTKSKRAKKNRRHEA